MRTTLTFASLALGASAAAIAPRVIPPISPVWPRDSPSCTFKITAQGGGTAKGPIGQLGDGQNRVGGGYPLGNYTWSGGEVWDGKGRGCILTPPTTQWQCDEGAKPTSGFDINCHENKLTYKGNTTFWACPVNDHGVWNLYSEPVRNQLKCTPVTLRAEGECTAKCAPPTPSPVASSPIPAGCGGQNPPCKPPPSSATPSSISSATSSPSSASTSTPKPSSTTLQRPSPTHHVPTPTPTPATPGCYPIDGGGKCRPSTTTVQWTTIKVQTTTKTQTTTATVCSTSEGKCKPNPPVSTPATSSCPQGSDGKCKPEPPKDCPTDLEGIYEFPHLIVPVDSSAPNDALGNRFNGSISRDVCTIFNFDIHARLANMTCSLIFLFPKLENLTTSSYEFHEKGGQHGRVTFYVLDKAAEHDTTWNSRGDAWRIGDPQEVYPGTSINVFSGRCPAGRRVTYGVCGSGFELEYFQDWNPAPIGMYVRAC